MKLWIDDVRPAPDGYLWIKTVNDAKNIINFTENARPVIKIELIDIGHDDGDDYIKLLDWLEKTDHNYPIRIHSQKVVGRMNTRVIIKRNDWKEVY